MENKKILIVDDEPDIRTVLQRRFELSGFECLMAENGQQAIEVAKSDQRQLFLPSPYLIKSQPRVISVG